MFREMRRKKKEISQEDCVQVLQEATNGTLAVNGDNGYPFSVPLSFVYKEDKIIFHSARAGHKIDSIMRNPKVSFSVVDQDDIVAEDFTTKFRSVIAFGKARLLEDGDEFQWAMEALLEKYSPQHMEGGKKYLESAKGEFYAVVIDVEHLTGKAGM